MANQKVSDDEYIESAVRIVAAVGIENTRTRDVAGQTGASEASMYRRFPSKEILLREAFLYIDRQLCDILAYSEMVLSPGENPAPEEVRAVWHRIFRYMTAHAEETTYMLRYRYSSYYNDEVQGMRGAFNGSLDKAYELFERFHGKPTLSDTSFLINCLFEITLCFAEKIVTGRIVDDEATEDTVWMAVCSMVTAYTQKRGENRIYDK